MCPVGHVRQNLPPLLICDGEKDPIVPGLHGRELYEKLKAVRADETYWMTPKVATLFRAARVLIKSWTTFWCTHCNLIPCGNEPKC